jgi:predicted nucleotidyltransferase
MRRRNAGIKGMVKEYFFANPEAKLRVRNIEKTLKLPLPSVIRYCRELKNEGLLATVKTGNVVFYTANRANGNFTLEKRLFNLKQVYEAGLIDYLKKELSNPVVILFGSYAKGEDTENSDIDLYVETPSKEGVDLGRFEGILKRKIQVFRHESIGEVSNKHLANNIINGIVLNGFIEVFK